ncbi:hypothetical protein [Spirulina sp. 06S082]|uniref:hypothetical protein n=1 Tax=Spirulina sp. 06S082 TaxID=3110248 RepID=UPI002B1EBB00|nr:hypothetical protein [Spirulina sp. 06S082]MEA5468704.1 hypothetical protein [Spirulina sp. 06S082]
MTTLTTQTTLTIFAIHITTLTAASCEIINLWGRETIYFSQQGDGHENSQKTFGFDHE